MLPVRVRSCSEPDRRVKMFAKFSRARSVPRRAAGLRAATAPIGSPRYSPDGEWVIFSSNQERQSGSLGSVYQDRFSSRAPNYRRPMEDCDPSFTADGKTDRLELKPQRPFRSLDRWCGRQRRAPIDAGWRRCRESDSYAGWKLDRVQLGQSGQEWRLEGP